MEIGFNARYLLDFLAVVGSPSVQSGAESGPRARTSGRRSTPGTSPGSSGPSRTGDMDYRYIVMPMHL